VKILKKDPQLKDAKIILTGGWTDIYKNHNEIFDIYDKNLTLKGLKNNIPRSIQKL
jgi:pantothenate kinase type III